MAQAIDPEMEVRTMSEPAVQEILGTGRRIPFHPERFRWEGIESQAYKFSLGEERGFGWRGVTRFVIGGPPEAPCRFQLRYFELAPGGYSSLEKHQHIHFIIVLRGRGKALVGQEVFEVTPFDVVYVPPEVPHRWINDSDEPFGFLCPVDAERDPPRPVDEDEWRALKRNPITAPYVF